ncbi:hemerythrin domain-containing protein [Psychroflexus sp. ALD_RP9]|uniref:hemerythrin domain-containing protein n=1 Tax=Psychroflexus sp. ALD_RP9 TaxID=2777186 RepID=UPI001A8D1EFB|nr:hemerythrin domain-containing protein [Psychroflexus sp. ALD_RP9]QSS96513.1 hemerythrin domain-containing protein [Psychroflexus sp. ALD_RP9]
MPKPLKRHPALQNLSREHHDILVFALRLKKGLKKAEIDNIRSYIDWFWKHYLYVHFQQEELYLFPITSEATNLTKKAQEYHEKLEQLFKTNQIEKLHVIKIYKMLVVYVRFEERKLFPEIQTKLSEYELEIYTKNHQAQLNCPYWDKPFWK